MPITETWLKSDSESVIEDMCPESYLYVGLSRKLARRGGVGVIYRSTNDLHKVSTDAYETRVYTSEIFITNIINISVPTTTAK